MPRQRHRDCWIATLRVSIPIDASDTATILRAQDVARELQQEIGIVGTTVEIIAQRFGRMAVQTSNSGADVDGKREATKQSEDAPESDAAAPQGGEGNCGTTTSAGDGIRVSGDNVGLPLAFDRRVPRVG